MNSKVTMVLRILLGVFMLFFGINKFAGILEFPPIPGDGGDLMRIWMDSGFMSLIGILEILGGLALLVGRFVPLALTILTAILFNAVLFHLMHDAGNTAGAAIGLILCLVLIYANKERFSSLLST